MTIRIRVENMANPGQLPNTIRIVADSGQSFTLLPGESRELHVWKENSLEISEVSAEDTRPGDE